MRSLSSAICIGVSCVVLSLGCQNTTKPVSQESSQTNNPVEIDPFWYEASGPAGRVSLSGNVLRPGTYSCPQNGWLSILQLLVSAGGIEGDPENMTVTIIRQRDGNAHELALPATYFVDDKQADHNETPAIGHRLIPVVANDLVKVSYR